MERIGAVSDGAAEDLIRSFVQFACAEGHLKTLIEKYHAELENGLIDLTDDEVRNEHVHKMNDAVLELDAVAQLRRGVMLQLSEQFDADTDYWCLIKHLGTAAYNLFEAYQASGDATMFNLALEADARFTKAMTHFLGMEITDCAACFADAMKASRKERDNG